MQAEKLCSVLVKKIRKSLPLSEMGNEAYKLDIFFCFGHSSPKARATFTNDLQCNGTCSITGGGGGGQTEEIRFPTLRYCMRGAVLSVNYQQVNN